VGYDAGKKVKGRKIHALVDTLGLPMRVVVHSAGTQDRDGAALIIDKIRTRFPWLELSRPRLQRPPSRSCRRQGPRPQDRDRQAER
jgi:transposase